MMKTLHDYVDICIIDEYAHKDFQNGYSLDVDDLSDHERANFLDELMKHDTSIKDLVLCYMQKLIDERLPQCETKDRFHAGIKMITLSNGDTCLVKGNYY